MNNIGDNVLHYLQLYITPLLLLRSDSFMSYMIITNINIQYNTSLPPLWFGKPTLIVKNPVFIIPLNKTLPQLQKKKKKRKEKVGSKFKTATTGYSSLLEARTACRGHLFNSRIANYVSQPSQK